MPPSDYGSGRHSAIFLRHHPKQRKGRAGSPTEPREGLMDDWHRVIAAGSELPSDAARRLCDDGFVILPGPVIPGGWAGLSEAYDRAVLTADPADVSVRSSTRVHDFVNRGLEFDGL